MRRTIGAYSYIIRGVEYDIPFREMIVSVLPVVDEFVIVSDPRFKDGTIQAIKDLKSDKVRLVEEELDLNNPGIDGATKAYARSLCKSDFLIQMDSDEVLRKEDLKKFRKLVDNWNIHDFSIIGTGVINWFNGNHFKMSSAGWFKERLSKNVPYITHGIPIRSRVHRGQYYYAKQDTDGAGYIDSNGSSLEASVIAIKDSRNILHDIVWSRYSIWINHYSWYSLPRKWQMKPTWHYFWGVLHGKYKDLDDYKINPDGDPVDFWAVSHVKPLSSYIDAIISEMREPTIIKPMFIKHPKIMKNWLKRQLIYKPTKKELRGGINL